MISRTLAIALALISTAAFASDIRHSASMADVIVIGRVTSVEEGVASAQLLPKRRQKGASWLLDRVHLSDVTYLKGHGPDTLDLPVRRGSLVAKQDSEGQTFVVGESGLAVWFLQRPNAEGYFEEDMKFARSGGSRPWHRGSFALAPMSLGGHQGSVIELATDSFVPSTFPHVALADLFARNVAAFPDNYGGYMVLVRQLHLPRGSFHFPDDELLEGENRAAALRWFREEYPKIVRPTNDEQRLNDIAVRLQWGQIELEDEYMALFKQLPRDAVKAAMPTLRKVSSILYFAEFGSEIASRESFVSLRQAPKSERRTILRVVQRCLGRSLYVDRAILECVYGLYGEPELNPWIETGYDPDITDQLKALDELIKRELPPEA